MLWHQWLINLSPQTLCNLHKHINGVLNLSKFLFDDINQCPTWIQANARKRSAGKRNLSDYISRPYQGFFYYAFSGSLARNKEGKIIKSSRLDVKGLTGETAWILLSDAQIKIIHGDTRTIKVSPVKYRESFLEDYSPNVLNKFVVKFQIVHLATEK